MLPCWETAESLSLTSFTPRRRLSLVTLLRTLRSDDGNETGLKKASGLITKTTTLHVHHAFLCISLPSLHVYDVKIPNFLFYRGCKHAATKFSFSLLLWIRLLGIQLQEGLHTFDKAGELELSPWRLKNRELTIKRRFTCRRCPRIFRSLFSFLQQRPGCTSVRYTLDTDPFKYLNRWFISWLRVESGLCQNL